MSGDSAADCFVCRKHRDRGPLVPGGPWPKTSWSWCRIPRCGGIAEIEVLVQELRRYLAD
jgi:hypothetical protein